MKLKILSVSQPSQKRRPIQMPADIYQLRLTKEFVRQIVESDDESFQTWLAVQCPNNVTGSQSEFVKKVAKGIAQFFPDNLERALVLAERLGHKKAETLNLIATRLAHYHAKTHMRAAYGIASQIKDDATKEGALSVLIRYLPLETPQQAVEALALLKKYSTTAALASAYEELPKKLVAANPAHLALASSMIANITDTNRRLDIVGETAVKLFSHHPDHFQNALVYLSGIGSKGKLYDGLYKLAAEVAEKHTDNIGLLVKQLDILDLKSKDEFLAYLADRLSHYSVDKLPLVSTIIANITSEEKQFQALRNTGIMLAQHHLNLDNGVLDAFLQPSEAPDTDLQRDKKLGVLQAYALKIPQIHLKEDQPSFTAHKAAALIARALVIIGKMNDETPANNAELFTNSEVQKITVGELANLLVSNKALENFLLGIIKDLMATKNLSMLPAFLRDIKAYIGTHYGEGDLSSQIVNAINEYLGAS